MDLNRAIKAYALVVQAQTMATRVRTLCWTLWGSRRDAWIQPGHGPRDVFGFAVEEDTMVVLTSAPWIKDPLHTGFVQQVDYPHGLRFQQYTHLHMINDEFDCRLENVVSVRAVLHFLHLWQRNAKKKKMLRRHAQHVLLLLCKTQLPPSVGYEINQCFRLQSQPQMQQPWLASASTTRAPHIFSFSEMD